MAESEEGLRQREGDQALPTPNDEVSCQQRFMDWVNETAPPRMELGLKRYGTLLQPFNGRDFMRDSFEELFDLSVYMQGVAAEREAMLDLLFEVAGLAPRRNPVAALVSLRDRALELLVSMGQAIERDLPEPLGEPVDDVDLDLGREPGGRPSGLISVEEQSTWKKGQRCPIHDQTDCSPLLNGCSFFVGSVGA